MSQSSPFHHALDAVADRPVMVALTKQMGNIHGKVDLVELWHASGRKRNKSPRQWLANGNLHAKDVTFEGNKPNDPVWAPENTAMIYASILDHAIMMAAYEAFSARLEDDPVRVMLECPDSVKPLMGLFASSVDTPEAIIREAVARTEHLDVYAQETEIAKIQRAFKRQSIV